MRDAHLVGATALMAVALMFMPWFRPVGAAPAAAMVEGTTGQQMQVDSTLSLNALGAMALGSAAVLRGTGRIGRRSRGVTLLSGGETPVPTLTLSDVAGNAEARDAMLELCDFLSHPETFSKTGARPPSGVLLWGPPGTGKTTLARALAGEAGVPFFAATGSDFVQMYAGVGASRVRDLFKNARAAGKCVVFIDEIDALGRRGIDTAAGGERDQTLNALLTEMSGFVQRPGVMVVAATNRPEMLDDALMRPGRFDRAIHVGLPDREARAAILAVHARNKPMRNVDFLRLAARLPGFSGAQIERLLNEAAILAARRGSDGIESCDLDSALLHIVTGTKSITALPGQGQHTNEKSLHIAAVHEAGHALLTKLCLPTRVIERVSVLRGSGGMGGFCFSLPEEASFHRRDELLSTLITILGGRAAEAVVFGPDRVSTGASDDLRKATQLAFDMIARYGMDDDFGPLSIDALSHDASASRRAHEACARLLSAQLSRAESLLHENLATLTAISDALVANLTLDGLAIDELLSNK